LVGCYFIVRHIIIGSGYVPFYRAVSEQFGSAWIPALGTGPIRLASPDDHHQYPLPEGTGDGRALDQDVMCLTVLRPRIKWVSRTARVGLLLKAVGRDWSIDGFVTIPSVAELRYEQHPFSFANIQTNGGAGGKGIFLIRAHDSVPRPFVLASPDQVRLHSASIDYMVSLAS